MTARFCENCAKILASLANGPPCGLTLEQLARDSVLSQEYTLNLVNTHLNKQVERRHDWIIGKKVHRFRLSQEGMTK